jgi:regulator of sirC expression with transglutaminase-like and TPR domain
MSQNGLSLGDSPLLLNRSAFELMKDAIRDLDTPESLVRGAVAIARHVDPAASYETADLALRSIAEQVNQRVRTNNTSARLAHLHAVLFDEMVFAGNSQNFHDPINSYLPVVLETRRGLPITLSLIYYIVARRVGLRVRGVGLPGHFCVGVETDRPLMIIDCFYSGKILTQAQALERMRDTYGDHTVWSDDLLRPIDHRHWLTRILQNLCYTFDTAGEVRRVASLIELQLLLWPDQLHLYRDLGVTMAKLGMAALAREQLSRYIRVCPGDPCNSDIRAMLETLR